MSREADYDVDLFAEMVRSGVQPTHMDHNASFVVSEHARLARKK